MITARKAPVEGCVRRASQGMTLVETMIVSALSTLLAGPLLMVVMETAKEQRRGTVDAELQLKAAKAQSQVADVIRHMSATEGSIMGDAVASGSSRYRKIITAKGATKLYPREELYFVPSSGSLYHDPDRTVTGDEKLLFKSSSSLVLTNMYFYLGIKSGGVMDGSMVNIYMEFTDGGYAGLKGSGGTLVPISATRTFTVKMRNS